MYFIFSPSYILLRYVGSCLLRNMTCKMNHLVVVVSKSSSFYVTSRSNGWKSALSVILSEFTACLGWNYDFIVGAERLTILEVLSWMLAHQPVGHRHVYGVKYTNTQQPTQMVISVPKYFNTLCNSTVC